MTAFWASLRPGWAVLSLLAAACGGGGGGSGGETSGGGGGLPPGQAVTFEGFGFRLGTGVVTDIPPMEDIGSSPPQVGAGLNTTVIFRFDGVPQGPFNGATLPVFTTPAEVTPAAGVPGTVSTIPAKGTYALVVDAGADLYTVEFHPFVPLGDVNPSLSADPSQVPGLLPGSIYTAVVSTTPGSKLPNLLGPGGQVKFGTTSNPAAYYPTNPSDAGAPAVIYTDGTGSLVTTPADGSPNFDPGVWSAVALGALQSSFPPGPADVLLTYDRALRPASENVVGSDLNGDGVFDATFYLETRATEFFVGHVVPANGVVGAPSHGEFAAISAYESGDRGDTAGGDVLLHGSTEVGLPGLTQELSLAVKSLASGSDANLLYSVLEVPGGTDLLGVGDYFAGDPSFAQWAFDDPSGMPVSLDTGLDDLVGLIELLDGRLVGFDRTSRTVVELAPQVERRRPTPDQPAAEAPLLVGLTVASGASSDGLFRSAPWPAGLTVHDLAQAPSGRLFALGTLAGAPQPTLVRLVDIDRDLDGSFDPLDGTWSGSSGDVVYTFSTRVEQLEFLDEHTALLLDRSTDSLMELDLLTGNASLVVSNVAGFDLPLPSGLSPAQSLAMGRLRIDLMGELIANAEDGAVVSLVPEGVLPIGADLMLMQRNALTSLAGTSELNADPSEPLGAMGAKVVLHVTTALPLAGADAAVSDVFLEEFVDKLFENPQPAGTNPLADWADLSLTGSGTSGDLRASVGASDTAQLGDFVPKASQAFNPSLAYVRSSASLGEVVLDWTRTSWNVIVLDTDAQQFPLPDGSTPGLNKTVTVFGGHFVFRDLIIPEGVRVVAKGSRPLRITATGTVRIDGVLDLAGTNGLSDDTFNSGFLPVPGGPGGPGAGRGGDSHPTLFDPAGSGQIFEYVTPETAERGYGPRVDASGSVTMAQIGGFGGLSTLGYDPNPQGFPVLDEFSNREEHRPPGGGGGTFYMVGDSSHVGSGTYRVQSNSTWFPFSKCADNVDNIQAALYGNDEFIVQGFQVTPLQCVYMLGTPQNPERFQPGALPGDLVFRDGDPLNDFIGEGGELQVLIGGQGGGGGGTRIDSMRQRLWSANANGDPNNPPPLPPPHYPGLFFGLYFSPTLYDAKGGAGGGGGGSAQIQAYGDIVIGRMGHIEARGGHGGGGEVVQNANFAGGGGGGSGGAILLQAANRIVIQADPGHVTASYMDADGDHGASIDVSGGFGRDARADPTNKIDFLPFEFDSTRSDGGQGGMGLIQFQVGGPTASPEIEQGAYVFAKKRATLKLGKWTGDNLDQAEHPTWTTGGGNKPPDVLRYIDMIQYRYFTAQGTNGKDRYMVLNGSYPPIIPSATGDNGTGLVNEWPENSGQRWFDTAMTSSPLSGGVAVVREPQPQKVMKSYLGWNPVTFEEPFWQQGPPPGELYGATDVIPMVINVLEPDGTPPMVEEQGVLRFDPAALIDRLPVVYPGLPPPALGALSQGTSRWLPFHGVGLRPRDGVGRTPPFMEGLNGTYNASAGVAVPTDLDGVVRTDGAVPSLPAHYVVDTQLGKGLFPGSLAGQGVPPNPPFNDIKVDAPDPGIGKENMVTDNAQVRLVFQGAYGIRPGSGTPDPMTLTDWVADPTQLDGYPLIRFRVAFDLAANSEAYPFGVDSLRPSVDRVRLRLGY